MPHQPWKNPPLLEAVFEIRFPPLPDYALFLTHIHTLAKEKYPHLERVKTFEIDMPPGVQIGGIPLHRFINSDKNFLFQTGIDLISVNVLAYKGFAAFLEQIKEVLVSVQAFVEFGKLSRVGLRYINRFEVVEDNALSSLNVNIPFNDMNVGTTKEFSLSYVRVLPNELFLNIRVYNALVSKATILDIDVSKEALESTWELDNVLDWVNTSHEIVWDSFSGLISDQEKRNRA